MTTVKTPDFGDFPFAGPQLATFAAYGARFKAFTALTDPLLAVIEAAQLKGRLDVLQQLGMFDPNSAKQARQLIDLALTSIHDTFLDWKINDAQGNALMADLRDEIGKL